MLPTFMNIFIIYSFCNVHDVTWGTRDSNLINNEKAQHDMEVSYVFLVPYDGVDTNAFGQSWCCSGWPETLSMQEAFYYSMLQPYTE